LTGIIPVNQIRIFYMELCQGGAISEIQYGGIFSRHARCVPMHLGGKLKKKIKLRCREILSAKGNRYLATDQLFHEVL
jgi:hypothetical protein